MDGLSNAGVIVGTQSKRKALNQFYKPLNTKTQVCSSARVLFTTPLLET